MGYKASQRPSLRQSDGEWPSWGASLTQGYDFLQACVNRVNIQQMDLPLANSVPWVPFSLMRAVHHASHVEEVFSLNI